MNLKTLLFSFALTTTLVASVAASTTLTAYDLIDNLSKEILATVRESNNKENIRKIIDDKYIERIDFLRITKISAGTIAFNNATKNQQDALVREYSDYLIGLITTAAYNLPDYTIELIPTDKNETKKKAEVGLKLKNTKTNLEIRADFILHSLDGPWKIYDLNIAGTSAMIASKFFIKSSIEENGIDGLIDELKKLNKVAIPTKK